MTKTQPRKTDPKVRAKVIRLLKQEKMTHREIAAACGVGKGTVSDIVSAEGLLKRKRLADERAERVQEEVRKGGTFDEVSRRTGLPYTTARNAAKRVVVKEKEKETVEPDSFPDAVRIDYKPFVVDIPGHWLVLSDVHIPQHDRSTVEAAVSQAKKDGAVGVILNGDVLDSHEVSTHDRDPSLPRYAEEVRIGVAMMSWIRGQLPDAQIVYKLGNHEERLDRYVIARAPALEGLEGFNTRSLLKFDHFGIDEVRDKRVIKVGKLHVIHGHEYRGAGGVFPARWLWYKARGVSLAGHFHRTSDYFDVGITGKPEAAWTVGCACSLTPSYAPLNSWNLGFAMVELAKDGNFGVRNMRVMNGKVL